MRKSLQLAVVMVTWFLTCNGVLANPGDWAKYSPATRDFEVQMPAPVDSQVKEAAGLKSRFYKAMSGDRNYVISAITVGSDKQSFDGFVDGIKDSIKDEKADIVSTTDATGAGWTGSLIEARKGAMKFCYLVAHATEAPLGYTLVTNASSTDSKSKEFLDSFVVHIPKPAAGDNTYGGLVDPQGAAATDTPFEEGRRVGYIVGLCLPIVLLVAFSIFLTKLIKGKKKK
ncbi:MAG TPA: hypothetical protein V6C89_05830 [Drouetiella sp.]|jgi:hypothetical protein